MMLGWTFIRSVFRLLFVLLQWSQSSSKSSSAWHHCHAKSTSPHSGIDPTTWNFSLSLLRALFSLHFFMSDRDNSLQFLFCSSSHISNKIFIFRKVLFAPRRFHFFTTISSLAEVRGEEEKFDLQLRLLLRYSKAENKFWLTFFMINQRGKRMEFYKFFVFAFIAPCSGKRNESHKTNIFHAHVYGWRISIILLNSLSSPSVNPPWGEAKMS